MKETDAASAERLEALRQDIAENAGAPQCG